MLALEARIKWTYLFGLILGKARKNNNNKTSCLPQNHRSTDGFAKQRGEEGQRQHNTQFDRGE